MSRKQPVERSVPHRQGRPKLRVASGFRSAVPQLSPAQALADIEAAVPSLGAEACLELLGAAARLSAALAARNLSLAAATTTAITPETDLLDAKGAARRLGVSLPTIYRLVRQRRITAVRIGADTLRFSPGDLTEFVSARRVPDLGYPGPGNASASGEKR